MSGDYYVGCIADLISGASSEQDVSPANNLFNKSKSYGTKKSIDLTHDVASVSKKKKKNKDGLSQDTDTSSVSKKRKRNEQVEDYETPTQTKKSKKSESFPENDEVAPKKKKKSKKQNFISETEFGSGDDIVKKKKKKAKDQRHKENIDEEEHEEGNEPSPSKKEWVGSDQRQPFVQKPHKRSFSSSDNTKTGKDTISVSQEEDEEDDQLEGKTPAFSNVPKKKDKQLEARTVFIGNVPVSYDKKKMKKLVSQFGSVDTIRFRSAPVSNPAYSKRVSCITKDFKSDRKSVNCYVRYKTVDEAHRALSFNGSTIDGLTVRVDMAVGKRSHDNSKAVFIGNVPFEAEEEELREEFRSCGEIEDVRIIRDPVTCVGKGFAYINFASSDGVQLAMELDGKPLRGRTLRVKSCVKKLKVKPGQRNSKGGGKTFRASSTMGKHGKRSPNKSYKSFTSKHRTQFRHGKKKQERTTAPSYAGEQTAEVKTTKKVKKPFMTKEERMKRKYAKMLTG